MTIWRARQVHEPRAADDGARVLVDRLWPRGVSKARADLDLWAKDIAPSTELRKWFHHHDDQVETFSQRYRLELESVGEALDDLGQLGPVVTLLSARADAAHVTVLLDVLAGR